MTFRTAGDGDDHHCRPTPVSSSCANAICFPSGDRRTSPGVLTFRSLPEGRPVAAKRTTVTCCSRGYRRFAGRGHPSSATWRGPTPPRHDLRRRIGVAIVHPDAARVGPVIRALTVGRDDELLDGRRGG